MRPRSWAAGASGSRRDEERSEPERRKYHRGAAFPILRGREADDVGREEMGPAIHQNGKPSALVTINRAGNRNPLFSAT